MKTAPFRSESTIVNISLEKVINDFADSLVDIDNSRVPHGQFQPGVGPYGEPQVVKLVASSLNRIEIYGNSVVTKRTPDLLIPRVWAIECKIARPFGDNGRPAENWSVNLLHPYEGNASLLGDCMKLTALSGVERKAVVVIGYEHTPPRISLQPLLDSFEVIGRQVLGLHLGERVLARRQPLTDPVHQQLLVCGWEVFSN